MKLLLKKGILLDPTTGNQDYFDILIAGPIIQRIDRDIFDRNALVIDVKDKIIVPGLVDVHVHFREPGQEHKETIATGSRAAAAGGFTTVVAEANTLPPIDTPSRVRKVMEIARKNSVVNFYTKASISRGTRGTRLIDIKAVKAAGAVAISDDGHPVPGKRLMRNAFAEARSCNILVSPHCEESELYRKRIMEKNSKKKLTPLDYMPYSTEPSRPYFSETGFIKREIQLAEETGARIHITHVSLASSVKEIAKAKQKGIPITCEATPHHLLLTEDVIETIGTNAKANPPLRSKKDVEAVRKGLADGVIDIIATDHAPHSPEEKSAPWDKAPFGIIGLETALGLVLTSLVRPGILTLMQAINRMSTVPARIFGLKIGRAKPGTQANLTVIDLDRKWKVDAEKFYSKGRNCPFDGWELQGKPVITVVKGRVVMQEGKIMTGDIPDSYRRSLGARKNGTQKYKAYN